MASLTESNGTSTPTQTGASLREDVPLRPDLSYSEGGCCTGVRFIAGCFGALSVGVSIALLAQVLSGAGIVGGGAAQHGAVASDAARCSRAGTAVLQAGGSAFDAAAAAAFCLCVLAPHRASIDASGALLLWEYRELKRAHPLLARWGGDNFAGTESRPPRLVAALAELHTRWGAVSWDSIIQPAVDIASTGFTVSEDLAAAFALKPNGLPEASGGARAGDTLRLPELAKYLRQLQLNTSAEWTKLWNTTVDISGAVPSSPAPGWALYVADESVAPALADLLRRVKADTRQNRMLLHAAGATRSLEASSSAGTGLAAVDRKDVYVSLVIGLSDWFGSGPGHDVGRATNLNPALFTEDAVCGRRYVLGASDVRSLTQVLARLALDNWSTDSGAELHAAIESPRALPARPDLVLLDEGAEVEASVELGGKTISAPLPRAAVNVVSQLGDALASHSDSRARGVASRF